ncbi:MAG: polymer-forming cytoskeletal protein [Hyphomicrobiales bacterium]
MFTRKTEKEPSPDTELFNNRLKELRAPIIDGTTTHRELADVSNEPLPVPEKLKKRAAEQVVKEPLSAKPRASMMQPQSDDAVLDQKRKPTETVISNDLIIEGSVTSQGVIRLEGTVLGDLHCSALVVEAAGSVNGNVRAETVNVHGRVEGTIHGDNVMLHSSAFVEGDIYHQGIGIDMGAQYDGRLQWVDTNAQTVSNPQAKQETHQNVSFYAEAAE